MMPLCPLCLMGWAAADEDGEDGDVGGVDARDSGGHAEVGGADVEELFAGFKAEG